jgi:hypothetical protein
MKFASFNIVEKRLQPILVVARYGSCRPSVGLPQQASQLPTVIGERVAAIQKI